jgi:hypothetical protein
MCQRDDWDFCVGQLKRIALDKFHKLMEPCKKQLMWVLQELIRARAKNLDGVFSGLLRHVASGDYTPKNTQLAASLLKMLQDNKYVAPSRPLVLVPCTAVNCQFLMQRVMSLSVC